MADSQKYIPALRFDWLTGLFDPVLSLTMPEKKFKQALIDQAGLECELPLTVLDYGCGTATLSLLLKQRYAHADVYGVDVDAKVLAIAGQKVTRQGLDIRLSQYNGSDLPYPNHAFDRVLSSLVFHHLTRAQKMKALKEIYRVLKPQGQLHIADWGKAKNGLMRSAFYTIQLLDGFATTTDNVKGLLPAYIEDAGFEEVRETGQYSTVFGTLSLYRAHK